MESSRVTSRSSTQKWATDIRMCSTGQRYYTFTFGRLCVMVNIVQSALTMTQCINIVAMYASFTIINMHDMPN